MTVICGKPFRPRRKPFLTITFRRGWGCPAGRSAKDLVAHAFLTDPPTAANPRLRLADYPDSSASWTSQHEGARFFGMGCAQLIRNLVTHGAQPDEQTALEQLASLSLCARLIDRAQKVAV
jgi:hypothetical protein